MKRFISCLSIVFLMLIYCSVASAATVATKLTRINITPESATLDVGKTQSFIVTGYDQNGKIMPLSQTVSWSSSNSVVGVIDNKGVFTGKSAGTTSIKATIGSISDNSNVTVKAAVLNGWHSDGETTTQKRIVAAARAENGKSSGQSVVGSGHQTDIDGGDGARMRNAINIHHDWKEKPGIKTLDQIKGEMNKAFSGSLYGSSQINTLVARIIQVYNPNAIPNNDAAVLNYLGIRKQCHEWADYIGGGETKGALSDIKKVRPGMGFFNNLPHAMIITDVNWNNGVPTQFKVCEANWASGWVNPKGAVPWERTVSCGRQVSVSDGIVRVYE